MNKLYGRKLKLSIVCNPTVDPSVRELSDVLDVVIVEQNGLEENGLRITFDIDYPGYQGFYYSEIVIYNFNVQTLLKVVEEGARVELSAGYVEGNFGRIFSGYVFQSLFEREGVVDYRLTLRCIDGAGLFEDNFCSKALEAQFTQTTLFNAVTAYSQTPIPIGRTTQLQTRPMPRAAVIHTTPAVALRELLKFKNSVSASNNQLFVSDGKVEVVSLTDPPSSEIIQISPGEGGLIGTPTQTDYGANFTCLLNPSITLSNPRKMVALKMSTVKQMAAIHGKGPISALDIGLSNRGSNTVYDYNENYEYFTNKDFKTSLDNDQEYQVIGVRHVGDTRGEEWYTHVVGLNKGGMQPVGFEEVTARSLPEIVFNKDKSYS